MTDRTDKKQNNHAHRHSFKRKNKISNFTQTRKQRSHKNVTEIPRKRAVGHPAEHKGSVTCVGACLFCNASSGQKTKSAVSMAELAC